MPGCTSRRPSLTKQSLLAARREARATNGEIIIRDLKLPGFGCRVQPPSRRNPDGYTSFFYRYRDAAGRQCRAQVAEWHDGTDAEQQIKSARTLAEKWRVQARDGIDPAAMLRQQRQDRRAAAGDTVTVIGEQFIAKHAAQRRWGELERVMRRDIMPAWGNRPVASVTRRDVIDLIDAIVDRGSPVQANRTLVVLKIFFGWCLDRDIITADPTARVRKPTKEAARERVLRDDELAAFWKGCDRLGWPFGPLLQLLALTAQRKSEIAHMTWPEIDANGDLVIDASKYKTGRPHVVPLSDPALTILGRLPLVGRAPSLVFTTNGRTPVSGFSKAKAELDRYMLDTLGHAPERWIIHDLRRTARSNLSKLNVSPDIAERSLGTSSRASAASTTATNSCPRSALLSTAGQPI